jgi:hypothetical protein
MEDKPERRANECGDGDPANKVKVHRSTSVIEGKIGRETKEVRTVMKAWETGGPGTRSNAVESTDKGPVWGSRQRKMGWIGYKFLNQAAWVRILVLRVRRYRHTELMILRQLQRGGLVRRLSLMWVGRGQWRGHGWATSARMDFLGPFGQTTHDAASVSKRRALMDAHEMWCFVPIMCMHKAGRGR